MKIWVKLLPFIIVEILAKKYLERWDLFSGFTSVKIFDNMFLSWRKNA